MRTTVRNGLVAAVAIALLVGPVPAPAASAQQERGPTTNDFPSLDANVWSMQRRGLLVELAEARFADKPDDPETAELLLDISRNDADRVDQAIEVLRRLVAGDVDDVEAAARVLGSRSSDIQQHEARGFHRDDVAALVSAIRARVAEQPHAQAARTVRWLVPIENRLAGSRGGEELRVRLSEFVDEYAGTDAALVTQVDLIDFERDRNRRLARYDAFSREHPGTVAGAKALHAKGTLLHVNLRGRRGADPTERFMQTLAIVNDLESGRWPPCEWVEKAPELIIGFYAGLDPVYAPDNIARVLDAYRTFVAGHFELDNEQPLNNGIGYVVRSRIADLHTFQGDRVGGVVATLDQLEREVTDVDALRFLRAEFLIREAREADPETRAALTEKGIKLLEALAETTRGTYARKALATIAATHFYEQSLERAADAYQRYLAQWPQGDWAWVATLRLGQTREALGDWDDAVESYRSAALTYPTPAPSAVFGNTWAARAYETLGRFDEAQRHYVEALSAWDDDFGPRYRLYTRHAPPPGQPVLSISSADAVTRADLTERIAELADSSQFSEGLLLESGRRLIEQQRWQDARAMLEGLVKGHPVSPLVSEARYLAHRARFEHALQVADIESPRSDEPTAFEELEALSGELWDPAVGAAGLARAAILGKAGYEGRAKSTTREALQE